MLSVDEALDLIVREVVPREPEDVQLREARGLALAEDITSPIDSPPFDKSQMDGFAVRAADMTDGPATLRIIGEVTAGQTSTHAVGPGYAVRIMTGAPIPLGADAVVPIERTTFAEGATSVTIKAPVSRGLYIISRGESLRKGETVLSSGTRLWAPQLGLLGELGKATVRVYPRPVVSVLATGDELVAIEETPGPGQIRNSNETMLLAQIDQAHALGQGLGIARDEPASLQDRISDGLRSDVLCLSGGVSAGKLDLVPSALKSAGVREVFHKVNVKPGKPVWFGVLDAENAPDGRPRYIFGLPGNPVSSMVCCELFVRSALRRLMGINPALPVPRQARLERELATRGDRRTYLPSQMEWREGEAIVTPVDWRGSFDLRGAVHANCMTELPAGDRTYSAGETMTVYEWT